jgi:hypothetical protein
MAENHDWMVEALLPAIAAKARAATDPDGARALLRESIEKIGKIGEEFMVRPSPSVTLARLVPLTTRIDPDRAADLLWLSLSRRPPLPALPVPPQVVHLMGEHYRNLAELAALTARYDRAAAEVVFAPVAARLVATMDDNWGLGQEGPATFRAAAIYDARAAERLWDALPEDPPPPKDPNVVNAGSFRHHSKVQARIALAETLALPPAIRFRESRNPNSDEWLKMIEDDPTEPMDP